MGLFSLDIERFYQEIKDKGGLLKGFFCLQYPIYCIHANIRDISPDPLDEIDQIICDLLSVKPDFKAVQIATIIGTTKSFVELRLDVLSKERYLKREGSAYVLTESGLVVFNERKKRREHQRSFDFFLDGVTLKPLPSIFYTFYRSKLISEHDSYYHTGSNNETYVVKPFSPDMVHTPPDGQKIVDEIFSIPEEDREDYNIPIGLLEIEETAFTRQTFSVLVAVSSFGDEMVKEIIDGHGSYSLADELSYHETMKKNVQIFEPTLGQRIKNLVFKINIPKPRADKDSLSKPFFTSNWTEIDRYKQFENSCFSFSSEDLIQIMGSLFLINDVSPERIVNTETSIEVNLTKAMLLNSSDRNKLIENLIRERDYHLINKTDRGVFLIYLYYTTDDLFVRKVVQFKRLIKLFRSSSQFHLDNFKAMHPEFSDDLRELLIASGEHEMLEKIDIDQFMVKL